jgi:hypothetical protein
MAAPRRRKLTAEQIAALPPADFLAQLLADTIRDIEAARECESWQAVATLSRQAAQHRAELDALAKAAQQPATGADTATLLDDDALLAGIVEAIPGLPDAALDAIEDALVLRRTGRPNLRVHAGGEGAGA